MVMVLLLFAYYLTFTTNLSADVYGISAMHGYKPVELFLLVSLQIKIETRGHLYQLQVLLFYE